MHTRKVHSLVFYRRHRRVKEPESSTASASCHLCPYQCHYLFGCCCCCETGCFSATRFAHNAWVLPVGIGGVVQLRLGTFVDGLVGFSSIFRLWGYDLGESFGSCLNFFFDILKIFDESIFNDEDKYMETYEYAFCVYVHILLYMLRVVCEIAYFANDAKKFSIICEQYALY